MILFAAWASEKGSVWPWAAGIAGAFLTALYAFRLVFLVFFGEAKIHIAEKPGLAIHIPLVILAAGAAAAGFVEMPREIASVTAFSDFISRSLPAVKMAPVSHGVEMILFLDAMVAPLLGVWAAWWLYLARRDMLAALEKNRAVMLMHRISSAGWGFDALYDALFVRPFTPAARINRNDFVDLFYRGIAWVSSRWSVSLAKTQSGMVRQYALGVTLGVVIALALIF
jgi:NADH-quinone oxidoreductase subunit L